MKKIVLIFVLAAGCIINKPASAQVSVNINIGAQPVWGPVGYDYVEYYYLPDIETYYYVPTRQYIYLNNGNWIYARALPSRYSYYNVYTGYKVVINEPRPYLHFASHKVVYAKYKGNKGKQVIIRNSSDPKYYVVKGHPKYNGGGNKKVVTTKSRSNAPVKVNSSKGNSGTPKGNSGSKGGGNKGGGGKGKGKN